MFLTRIKLDTNNRNTMRALASPSRFHGALESTFSGDRPHILWRLDYLNGQLYLLFLSETEPELTAFCKQFSTTPNSWETKCYDGLLERVTSNSCWRFRLTANPTKSLPAKSVGSRGKVCAHITTEYQRQWLADRAEKHGFSLESFDVVESKWIRFFKQEGRPVTMLSVKYEGMIRVTDPEQFRSVLINGIGRGKAYGMGLMTIMH